MKLHVVFRLAGSEYALPVDEVLQMESFSSVTSVPGTPVYVAGIVTVRGRVLPVIDLRVRFGLPKAEPTLDTRMIVAECAGRVFALVVDSARDVLALDPEKHQPAPSGLAGGVFGFMRAVHPLGQRLLLLPDLRQILGENSHGFAIPPVLDDDGSTARARLPG